MMRESDEQPHRVCVAPGEGYKKALGPQCGQWSEREIHRKQSGKAVRSGPCESCKHPDVLNVILEEVRRFGSERMASSDVPF